jgi:hypothetical protein
LDLKSAELQDLVKKINSTNVIVFDAATPDLYKYLKYGLRYLVRLSDFENLNKNILTQSAYGVCVDSLVDFTLKKNALRLLAKKYKLVLVISNEIHQKNHLAQWNLLKHEIKKYSLSNIYLCTDLLEEAKVFFND